MPEGWWLFPHKLPFIVWISRILIFNQTTMKKTTTVLKGFSYDLQFVFFNLRVKLAEKFQEDSKFCRKRCCFGQYKSPTGMNHGFLIIPRE